ncbi:hypothetical protein D8S78_12235 [Natrialba swarupiae]|nr:hypothetical protein [Natrialba swarupiae]
MTSRPRPYSSFECPTRESVNVGIAGAHDWPLARSRSLVIRFTVPMVRRTYRLVATSAVLTDRKPYETKLDS